MFNVEGTVSVAGQDYSIAQGNVAPDELEQSKRLIVNQLGLLPNFRRAVGQTSDGDTVYGPGQLPELITFVVTPA